MRRQSLNQASRLASRAIRSSSNISRSSFKFTPSFAGATTRFIQQISVRSFATTQIHTKGIMPETENPAKEAAKSETSFTVVELSDGEYHEIADKYLENVLEKIEELQDAREDVDIEFSSGVMTINFPDKGTYVVNKQPPNKQIWLSSPQSGPKRYDWCIIGEGQNDKEDTASGDWIYGRDNSSLSQLFLNELGVDVRASSEE